MSKFFAYLGASTALFQVPFALCVTYVLRRLWVPHPAPIAVALASLAVVLLYGRVREAMFDAPRPAWRRLLVTEPYYIHWCATVASVPLFLSATVTHAAFSLALGLSLGDVPVFALAAGSYALGLVLSFWSVVVRRRWVRVRLLDVPVEGLPAAFDGYRIAQLSDLHLGQHHPRSAGERWAAMVARLDCDLVALTGDYVTSGTAFHDDIVAVLTLMRGRDGVVAVMGNHDYFGDAEGLIDRLRAGGVLVLRNQSRLLERGGACLTLAGVDDTWTRRADVPRTLSGIDPALSLIVLAHDPNLFPALALGGANLVLSGHTHWGQIGVPFSSSRYNLSRLMWKRHAGLYRDGKSVLYVNPGLGTTGPPVRFGVAPEITVVRLVRA